MTGKTRHWMHTSAGAVKIDDPAYVEIDVTGNAAFLLRFDADGRCIADTWHKTVAQAKDQANFEFEITEDDWQTVVD